MGYVHMYTSQLHKFPYSMFPYSMFPYSMHYQLHSVWKRCRDGALYIHFHFCIIPTCTLYEYFWQAILTYL